MAADYNIERISNSNRIIVKKFLVDNWYSTTMTLRGKTINLIELDGLLLKENDEIIGLITYMFVDHVCEIVSLDSKKENLGIGTMLLNEIEKIAKKNNCKKILAITTNDNMRALQFYQKRGYCINKIYPNIMDEVRRNKPNVPIIGINGIPLRDEIELVKEI